MIVFNIHIALSAGEVGSISHAEKQQVHASLVEYCGALTNMMYPDIKTFCEVLLEPSDQSETTISIQDIPCRFSTLLEACPPYLLPWQHLAQQYGEIIFRNRQLFINEVLIEAIMKATGKYNDLVEKDTYHALARVLVKNGFSTSFLTQQNNQLQEDEDPALWLERIAGKAVDLKMRLWVGRDIHGKSHPADTTEPPEIFNLLAQGIYYELGILIPPPVSDRAPLHDPLAFRITVNDLPWPMMHSIGPDFFICNLTDSKHENNLADPGKPNHPKFKSGHSMRPITDLEKLTENNEGITTWGTWGLLVLQVSRIIREMSGAFINRFSTEALQTKYHISPHLKRLFTDRYSGDFFTAILRQLAWQGVPIRNLSKIMEAMVAAGDYAESDITLIEFLPQPTVLSVRANDHFNPEKELLKTAELVRRALREEIAISLSANYQLNVLVINPHLEERLMTQNISSLPEAAVNEILELLDTELSGLAVDRRLHAILTVDVVRPVLETVLMRAYPTIKVVSYSELTSNVSIEVLGRL
jgi:type III secretory pathway component EscV